MPGYLRPNPETILDDEYFDAVNKLRVSQAQALIDTDFEYGMQISKWENLGLLNNRPFSFPSSNTIPDVSSVVLPQNSEVVEVTTSSPHGLSVGMPINVQDTFLTIANGNFIIETVSSDTTFTYTARALNISSTINSLYDPNKTAMYIGTEYTNAKIGGTLVMTYDQKAITVTTTVPHGLSLGNEIAITGTTADTNAPNGSFYVATVLDADTFIYYANSVPTGTLVATSAKLYVRPQAQFLHRPFDGGVLFSANASSANQQAVRQTRRYFRYQSGKGVQISSGTVLKPNLSLESLTSSGDIITVQTKEQHNLQPGSSVTIYGASPDEYNGTFTIIEILGYNLFTVEAESSGFAAKASGNYYATVQNWYGCTNRIGMFDSQNGVFFEFDGQKLYAVRRNSTYQLAGKVSVDEGTNIVSQTNAAFPTNFSKQLNPGDFVVLRGQSYRVESISSDTELTITPSYRGTSADYVLIAKTEDLRIPQEEWNLDTMDGNGPSGYNIDLTKMQMFYIDYSWYGAGFIRWGLRGVDGDIKYVHKIANNNVNAEAYMRTGNLPARYESNTFGKATKLRLSFANNQTETLAVDSTEGFSPTGTLLIRFGTTYEYINYTGKTINTFTGLTRARTGATTDVTIAAGSNLGTVASITGLQVGQRVISDNFPENTYLAEISGNALKFNAAAIVANPEDVIFAPMAASTPQTFNFSSTQPTSIEQAFPTYSASISHWGTSVIIDGGFDDDKSLIFTFGQVESTTIPKSATVAATTTVSGGNAGSNIINVVSAEGIVTGMTVVGAGVQEGSVVKSINGTAITISLPLVDALSSDSVSFIGGNTKALFSIRVAPSVDNGISASFGSRELVNRMQLALRTLGVATSTENSTLLVTAILNGVPSSSTAWTNIVKGSNVVSNSSLAQVADYAGLSTIVLGGEVTGGFYVQGTSAIDLNNVRDLGNSILGGGSGQANTNVYPDGPDVLSIVVTNLSDIDVDVLGRLGWAEAQA